MDTFETFVREGLRQMTDETLAMDVCELSRLALGARVRGGMLRLPPDYMDIFARCVLDEQKRRLRG